MESLSVLTAVTIVNNYTSHQKINLAPNSRALQTITVIYI